jgi:hypothetical protein
MFKLPNLGTNSNELPDQIAAENRRPRARRNKAASPEVGIFFVHGGRLWIEGTPVTDVPIYADMKTHDKGHDAFFEQLREYGAVPVAVEYDEVPRGRVCYDTRKRIFHLYVDRCIPKGVLEAITDALSLPSATEGELDPHYRCPGCMSPGQEQDEK